LRRLWHWTWLRQVRASFRRSLPGALDCNTSIEDNSVKRPPLLEYVLCFVSLGFYMIYWAYKMMANLNAQGLNPPFKMRRDFTIAGLYVVVYLATFSLLDYVSRMPGEQPSTPFLNLFFVTFFLAIGWFALISNFMARLARGIASVQRSQGQSPTVSPGLAAFLFFIYFASIPYLQAHWNRGFADDRSV